MAAATRRKGKKMDQAFDYLNRDPLHHVDMLECLRRGSAGLLEASAGGVLLLDSDSGAYMLSARSEADARRMIARVDRAELFVLHQEFGRAAAEEKFSLHGRLVVRNAAYLRGTPLPPAASPARIRRMDESFLPFLREHYALIPDEAYLLGRVRAGVMFGAFVGGEPAGFVGMHEEGSIGMLEVLPAFRRRGIARALESFLVNRLLGQGRVPYGQIEPGNLASWELNRRLGFTFSESAVCWLTDPG